LGRSAICLDREWERIQGEDSGNLKIPMPSTNLAYTIYTSGSTGRPKGVMIEHRSAVNFLTSMQKEPGFNENDVLLAVTTVSFDIAAMELLLPLITGGMVVMARKDEVVDGHLLLKLIERRGVTTLQATPATWKLLIDAGWRSTPRLRMLCGGEPLPRELANQMLKRGGELWNMYGPTETTIWSSVQKIELGSDPVLIGPPIANTQFYIVDRKMQPVPIGVPGELLIGGDGLSRGYLNHADLSAERFVVSPFINSGCRVYRTGDLARFRSNGAIEFLGRLDFQVKVRGFRVELGEIEQCLIQHEGVHDAVVLSGNDESGDKRLVAYFIPVVGAEISVSGLREFLQKKLPAYMIPSFFVEMETFPLTPNGKIDRRSFPEPEESKLECDTKYVAPQSELELQLAELWRKALKVERIGVDDNFFELGGHSLLAAQLFAQIERKLGVNIPLAIVFQAPSIRQLSEKIQQKASTSNWAASVPRKADYPETGSRMEVRRPVIPRRPYPHSAPLSFAQRQMWVIDQMTPGNPAYILSVGQRLRGPLDLTALENSFNEVIKRHEVLRTTFLVEDGEPLQRIHPELKITIKVSALDHLTGEEREAKLQALASEESLRSFALTQLPLIRASLFKLGEAEQVLIINLHHIVADGLSIGLLFDELDAFYRAFTGGGDPRPPELSVQYADFALWQRQTIANETAYANQIDFWRTQLGGKLPVLELPGDKPRPVLQSFNGSNVVFNIPTALTQDLRSLGAREGCSFFLTVLAAFQVLLQRYSGAEDVVIGTPVAVRTPVEVEPLIGNFLNMAALRCDLSGDPTFIELLLRSRDTTSKAFSNTDLPFEAMMKHLKFERDPSRNPIFQVLLTVLSNMAPRIGGLDISSFHFHLNLAQFDLSLRLYEEGGGYTGAFEYCTDLFHADTIERMALNFIHLLEGIVRDPEQKISKISILAESERHRTLVDWNSTSRGYPKEKCLHQLFEETAGTAGGRRAVECDGRVLTYRELNAKANQLANYLLKCGVKTQSFVGIHLDRSSDLLVGLLGILKAGAAYVPLDPSFPPDRLVYMMEDAKISTIVTQTELLGALPVSGRSAICLDREWKRIQGEGAGNLNIPMPSTNLAYTIYTSGSTGRPKGVMIEHRSAVNFLTSMQKEPGFNESDVLLAVTTVSFDIAAMELFLPLITGGTVVMARKDEVVDGHLLLKLIERRGVTTLQATPATWKLLIDAGWRSTPRLKMLCGGEPLPRELANQMLERSGELWNMYGPTETTIWSSVQKIEPGNDPVLIGPPIANTQFYIVDRKMQPVPIGVPGELLVGGDGLSRGYLNHPDLTAERFIVSPFINSGCRVYRTGDLARFCSNGTIEFLGRLDFQVKVRGFRVELGEIEQCLVQHEGVHDAVVLTRNDESGDKRLVAYFIPAVGGEISVSGLREFLQKKLPAYMIPSFFVEMEIFPLTPNGKIDRRSFPEPEKAKLECDTEYAAPKSELELQLAELWRKALKVERIGVDDNFFELGGHSLLAAQLFAQIERKLGVNLPLAILFQAPSIRQLSQKIKQNTWKSSWKSLVPIQPQGDKPALFLIHGAEGNVLLYNRLSQKLGKDQPLYGLQSRGLDGREPMETKFESMAAKYLEEIKAVQPKGPYYLGGYCLGGTIALEIAQQLKKAGDEVALLAMIETYNIQSRPPVSFLLKLIHKAQNSYFQLRNLLLSLSKGSSRFFIEKYRVEIGRLKVKWDILYSEFINQFHPGRRLGYQHLRIHDVNDRAQAAYRPLPYDGKITLFRTKAHFRHFDDWSCGWGEVAKQAVEIVEMPNYPRGSLNDPFVDLLADRLRAKLENVPDGNSSPRGSMKNLMKGILLYHSFISYFHFIQSECKTLLDCCAVGGIIC
jgi:amino acid adenylation domain-containing protein